MAAYDWRKDPTYAGMEAPRPRQEGRFEPSMEDRATAAAMSAAGLFLPASMRPGCTPGAAFRKTRGKWGKALTNWTEAGCPVPPEKPWNESGARVCGTDPSPGLIPPRRL
jgi:hypothetical protein